ncbi:hypothetical protein CRM22_002613 [Opisthorchis felineus]|uniref:Peptidase A1 domain-containing protein n=1 Tax=Opisthorchis felineus TaxID=147828 RepID=A0A4S2M5C6_OPIFE|nr:hypothetical protein CRM22_002613 [Opisthorchis felineus]
MWLGLVFWFSTFMWFVAWASIEIPLWRSCGRHYCGPLSLGTPMKQFKMLFDTGSCNTWVRSVNSKTKFTDQAYDWKSSESAEIEQNQQTMGYANCRITGIVVRDSVMLGNKNVKVRFASGVELSQSCPPRMSFDGIVGLCAVPGNSTFLNQLVEADIIDDRIFSIWINPNTQELLAGSVILGGVHDGLYSGTLNKVSLEPLRNWWCFRLTGVRIDDGKVSTLPYLVAVDSGATKLWVPESLLKQINDVLHPIGFDGRFHLVDCSNIPKKPIVHFEVGEFTLSMEPKYYIRSIKKDGQWTCQSLFTQTPEGNFPHILLGRPFLNKYYTMYDMEYEELGFALAKQKK